MNHKHNPAQYLDSISPNRIKSVKQPKQYWKGRARCFQLFDKGLKPRHISPRQCGVKRRTLYKYYQDWKIFNAKMELAIRQAIEEIAEKHRAQHVKAH